MKKDKIIKIIELVLEIKQRRTYCEIINDPSYAGYPEDVEKAKQNIKDLENELAEIFL